MKKVNYSYIIACLTAILVLIILIVFLLYYFRSFEATAPGLKLVIDQDGGADDAIAVFMALLNEKYFNGFPVIALTTTHGNVDETQTFNNTQKFLGIADRQDVPIYRGSNFSLLRDVPSDHYFGFDGLGDSETEFVDYKAIKPQPEHAAIALIELSKKFQGELIVLSLGALTNIALAIKLDPGFIGRLSQLYVAAGNIYSEEYKEPEFNALIDVESYRIVLQNSRYDKVTVIPFSQVLKSHNISAEWRKSVLGSIPTKVIKALNVFEQKSIVTSNTWNLLDPVAMAIVLNETEMIEESLYVYNNIHICENRGININNFTATESINARLIYKK
ncbi:unnamed protein product [Parnassius mnemosyne]|uniref:Inosine/uridine-preferring nucleoside hydrolase domain-containing protein n=1 Tax=Parnassius mnemosyne TaxID=213953 RepID=A0AAV1LXT9_9NEOP